MWRLIGARALLVHAIDKQAAAFYRSLGFRPSPRKNVMVGLLLADPNGPPPLSLLPPPKTKATAGGKAGTAELQALEQRLVRLEQLLLLIAQQVGVAPDAIARLQPPTASPT